ncbi:MAG: hypoxanthine phosphoribosyltransferase [Candidatus Caenarcaniphilales bacterium]|nr:hypoxanthine phosphoribosyltransferase [Candidatus Caenarcaniphilales bacterium]
MNQETIFKPTVLISAKEIQKRINDLAKEIESYYSAQTDFSSEPLIMIGVLKGAFIFSADLIRKLTIPIQLEFVRIASYGDSTESGELSTPDLSLPSNIKNKHILIVEDIVDTGKTASFLKQYIKDQFSPKSIALVSLLSKPSRRLVDIDPDFYGFEIEDKFVIGYGLDWAEKYRELDYLGVVDGNTE